MKKGKLGTATVSKNACGQYFVSFIVHTAEAEPQPVPETELSQSNTIGIDFGLKHFLTFDDGSVVDSPEYFRNALEKLAREQRRLNRKQKDSKNREKQRLKVATCHSHVANQRANFLHNVSTRLADESQVMAVCVEDLNLKGMMKKFGRKVSDLSYRMFTNMLEYKLRRRGKRLLKAGRFEPSSQTCSCCGHRQKMPLSERTYRCPDCGAVIDRDVNAARNVKAFALAEVKKICTDATSGTNACGVGGSGRSRIRANCETTDVEAGKSGRITPPISAVFNR